MPTKIDKCIDKFNSMLKKHFGDDSYADHEDDHLTFSVSYNRDITELDNLVEKLVKDSGLLDFFEEGGTGCGFGKRDYSYWLRKN